MHVIAYEILGRIGQDGLPCDPAELFDVAAHLGCASDLSVLFREQGVELGKRLPGSPLLFANADPAELNSLDVLVESLERTHGTAPTNRIVLEISEKAVPHSDDMNRFRDRLKDMDIALAFDDFGVGQTRLVELANTPPDYLKFDISLIRTFISPLRGCSRWCPPSSRLPKTLESEPLPRESNATMKAKPAANSASIMLRAFSTADPHRSVDSQSSEAIVSANQILVKSVCERCFILKNFNDLLA